MKPRDLGRLLRPSSIAVVGGGAWCKSVIEQCQKMGFTGPLWPVHPAGKEICGLPSYGSVEALPASPDATFIGVNRHATIEVVAGLAGIGAGGAVCFASGYQEAQAEDAEGADLQSQLLAAAGEMPILGPNCYGFINYLDDVLLWPDQHGGRHEASGVAVITQSSNIALNLTMQKRGLPLAYVVTAGNQAQIGMAEIGEALLNDARVTTLGLHIEGFGDLRAFEALAKTANALGKSVVALKVGKSSEAQSATISHTASLAGGDAGANAFLERLNILQVHDLPVFLEVLKLCHVGGRLPSNRIATISCSGGEASLAADLGHERDVLFSPLNKVQLESLRTALGPMVALANPLDYHTYIWRDVEAMTRTFAAMADPSIAMTIVIADFPRADRCDPSDWSCVTQAVISAAKKTGARYGLAATLSELLPEEVAEDLIAGGVVPFAGLSDAIAACAISSRLSVVQAPPILLPGQVENPQMLDEADAKSILASHGLRVPRSSVAASPEEAALVAETLGFPVVVKGQGFAHKTEAKAVALNLGDPQSVRTAAEKMPCGSFLVEEMISDAVAELLVGVLQDPAHGYVMTLGAGGVLTELMSDNRSFLLPATDAMIEKALAELGVAKLLDGYRGGPAANKEAIISAIRAIEGYVMENAEGLVEVEINPLICTANDAIAADALLRREADI